MKKPMKKKLKNPRAEIVANEILSWIYKDDKITKRQMKPFAMELAGIILTRLESYDMTKQEIQDNYIS